VDGNKRTAVATALVFLALNGADVDVDKDAFSDLVIGVAAGRSSKASVAVFLEGHAPKR
jgi:prophage maintenance system killer protein